MSMGQPTGLMIGDRPVHFRGGHFICGAQEAGSYTDLVELVDTAAQERRAKQREAKRRQVEALEPAGDVLLWTLPTRGYGAPDPDDYKDRVTRVRGKDGRRKYGGGWMITDGTGDKRTVATVWAATREELRAVRQAEEQLKTARRALQDFTLAHLVTTEGDKYRWEVQSYPTGAVVVRRRPRHSVEWEQVLRGVLRFDADGTLRARLDDGLGEFTAADWWALSRLLEQRAQPHYGAQVRMFHPGTGQAVSPVLRWGVDDVDGFATGGRLMLRADTDGARLATLTGEMERLQDLVADGYRVPRERFLKMWNAHSDEGE